MNEKNTPATLGQYLERGRKKSGLSLRQLAAASGVPVRTIRRILGDEVESPAAEDLQRLAQALELDEVDVFGYIGVTPPKGLPGIAPYLRAKHGLRGDALGEAAREIENIINKYDGIQPDK